MELCSPPVRREGVQVGDGSFLLSLQHLNPFVLDNGVQYIHVIYFRPGF